MNNHIPEWTQCVLDASIEPMGEYFTYLPIEGDANSTYSIVKGIKFIGKDPPKYLKLVAVIHPDGEEAVQDFGQRHTSLIEALLKRQEDK